MVTIAEQTTLEFRHANGEMVVCTHAALVDAFRTFLGKVCILLTLEALL